MGFESGLIFELINDCLHFCIATLQCHDILGVLVGTLLTVLQDMLHLRTQILQYLLLWTAVHLFLANSGRPSVGGEGLDG